MIRLLKRYNLSNDLTYSVTPIETLKYFSYLAGMSKIKVEKVLLVGILV